MWLANQTRPDISNAERAIANYAPPPKLVHWKAARNNLEYMKTTTSDDAITFQRSSGQELVVCADATYASSSTIRKYWSGGIVMCGNATAQCGFLDAEGHNALLK